MSAGKIANDREAAIHSMAGIASGFIDSAVFAKWESAETISPYLPTGWREYLAPPPGRSGRKRLVPVRQLDNPEAERAAYPQQVADGWDHTSQGLASGILSMPGLVGAAVCPEEGMMAAASSHPLFALELARATNRWMSDLVERLADHRVGGVVAIPTHLPEEAAKEIVAAGRDARFVAVALGANGLAKPFGHPVYHPIFRAASEARLPVMIHVNSDPPPFTLSHATGGGVPSTYAELYALRAQSVMSHLASIIGTGVMDAYPDLRLVIVGAGITWLPSFLWRIDNDYKAQGGIDVPWLKQLPSEHIRQRVRVTTYSPPGSALTSSQVKALRTVPWIQEVLCFGSGFPSWDASHPKRVAASLPAEWHEAVFRTNVRDVFRWQQ
jgi:predicted TIM-barrel fold metal-dependent hydrolase